MLTETVKEYVARDGARFKTAAECKAHEDQMDLIEPIMARLPLTRPEGNKYVQHDRETLLAVKRDLFAVVVRYFGQSYPEWRTKDPDAVHPCSIVGRVLSDNYGPLADAWRVLANYNFDLGREYEQPYFALNPEGTVPDLVLQTKVPGSLPLEGVRLVVF